MPRPITFAVSFFWMSAFAFLAVAVAGLIPEGPGSLNMPAMPGLAVVLLAIGFSLVATVFLWTFVAVIFDRGDEQGDIDWIARVAFASAILMMTAVLLVLVRFYPFEVMAITVLAVTALTASLVAIDAEGRAVQRSAKDDSLGAVAGRMAVGAAHNTMLSAISHRGTTDGRNR